MSLNVGNLAGDMYLNFFILSLVEIPGALLIWFFMSRYCIVLMIYDTLGILGLQAVTMLKAAKIDLSVSLITLLHLFLGCGKSLSSWQNYFKRFVVKDKFNFCFVKK